MEVSSECRRCGWCCSHIVLQLEQKFSKVDRSWLEARGIKVRKGAVIIPPKCQHLTKDLDVFEPHGDIDTGKMKCTIYENRPLTCRIRGCPKPPDIAQKNPEFS